MSIPVHSVHSSDDRWRVKLQRSNPLTLHPSCDIVWHSVTYCIKPRVQMSIPVHSVHSFSFHSWPRGSVSSTLTVAESTEDTPGGHLGVLTSHKKDFLRMRTRVCSQRSVRSPVRWCLFFFQRPRRQPKRETRHWVLSVLCHVIVVRVEAHTHFLFSDKPNQVHNKTLHFDD